MPLPLENRATMNLRCKDGDIAVITWDYPDCR
jgi:hypothetical protein